MRESLRLALDKSVRTIDEDGHLHVSTANISKAVVNPYRGAEIPDYQRLGLAPDKVYQLLRHPDELAKGARTFAGKPLLSVHRPTTASDHAKQITVGSIGSKVQFDGKYLTAPLTVWDAAAIDGIESDDQRELSCGYRYDADMTPGIYKGVRYDGVMRNIRGNHVALVESGRAGSDVIVGDSALVITANDATAHDPSNGQFTSGSHAERSEAHAAMGKAHASEGKKIKATNPREMPYHAAAAQAHGEAASSHARAHKTPSKMNTRFAESASIRAIHATQNTSTPNLKPAPKTASDASLIVKGLPPMKLSRAALLASGALRVYLAPKLATDAKVDLGPVLKGLTAKGWKANKPKLAAALGKATKGKLAEDASIEDVVQMLDQLDEVADTLPDETPPIANAAETDDDDMQDADATAEDDDGGMVDRVKEFLAGKLSPEDLQACITMMKPEVAATDADPDAEENDAEADKKAPPFPPKKKEPAAMDRRGLGKDRLTKTAMDAAIATAQAKSAKAAEQATIKRMNAIREAERIVRPWVGEVAMDSNFESPEAVFKEALDVAEVDLTGVPESAYRALLLALPTPQAQAAERARAGRTLAMDAAGAKKFSERFPNAHRLLKV